MAVIGYLRIGSWSYKFSKLASAIFKLVRITKNANMHANTIHRADENEQLDLIRTFVPTEHYREVRIPTPFYYDDVNNIFLEFLYSMCTTQVS